MSAICIAGSLTARRTPTSSDMPDGMTIACHLCIRPFGMLPSIIGHWPRSRMPLELYTLYIGSRRHARICIQGDANVSQVVAFCDDWSIECKDVAAVREAQQIITRVERASGQRMNRQKIQDLPNAARS